MNLEATNAALRVSSNSVDTNESSSRDASELGISAASISCTTCELLANSPTTADFLAGDQGQVAQPEMKTSAEAEAETTIATESEQANEVFSTVHKYGLLTLLGKTAAEIVKKNEFKGLDGNAMVHWK